MQTDDFEGFDAKLKQVNQKLKKANVRARIQRRGHSLYARATLPPKPDSKKTKPLQQDVALDLKATFQALSRAEAVAKKMGAALDLNEFDWAAYGVCAQVKTAGQTVAAWLAAFEQDYFEHHKRTPTTEGTFKGEYGDYVRRLPQAQLLTREILEKAIRVTEPDSSTRSRTCIAYKAFGKFAGINITFIDKRLKGTYSSHKPAPRDLPSDELIAESFALIRDAGWRWAYGMIATYGLRPHEVFHLDLQDLEQDGYLLKVLTGTKTGYREIRLLYPEWVDQFDLRQKRLPNVTGKSNKEKGAKVSPAFRNNKVPFAPYNLRHCYAVRCLRFGIDVSLAARWMGHNVQIHTKTYQAWISKEIEREVFERSIRNPNRPQPPHLKQLI